MTFTQYSARDILVLEIQLLTVGHMVNWIRMLFLWNVVTQSPVSKMQSLIVY